MIEPEEGWNLIDAILADKGWAFKKAGLTILRDRPIEFMYRDRTSLEVIVVAVDARGSERQVECYYDGDGKDPVWIVDL